MLGFQRVIRTYEELIGRITENAYNRHRIFLIFRGRGASPDGAQPLTFEGGWKAEQAPFRGLGVRTEKEGFSCALKSVSMCLEVFIKSPKLANLEASRKLRANTKKSEGFFAEDIKRDREKAPLSLSVCHVRVSFNSKRTNRT